MLRDSVPRTASQDEVGKCGSRYGLARRSSPLAPLVMSTNESVAARALPALPPSGTLAVGEQVKALRAQRRVPEGTFYLFPDISCIGLGGAALTRHLLAQA